MTALGIDIGSVNVKVCGLGGRGGPPRGRRARGRPRGGARAGPGGARRSTPRPRRAALATGGAGRRRLDVPDVIAPRAIEAALEALASAPARRRLPRRRGPRRLHARRARPHRRRATRATSAPPAPASSSASSSAAWTCVSRTSTRSTERRARAQALGALLGLHEVGLHPPPEQGRGHEGRHRALALQGDGRQGRRVPDQGQDPLGPGGARRRRDARTASCCASWREAWPRDRASWCPAEARYFEAFGAAHLARALGRPLPPRGRRLRPLAPSGGHALRAARLGRGAGVATSPRGAARFAPRPSTSSASTAARRRPRSRSIDAETLEIVAAHYGRTHGDPVAALKHCLREVRAQLGDAQPRITLCATTGSSRELLGVFLETDGVYNEIIAHAAGTTYFEPDVDTIFEIGGQDAKYVLLNNGVPIDYAMNEACSAGTGSFLEESAAGDLRHRSAPRRSARSRSRPRRRSSSASTARPSSTATSARRSSRARRAPTSWPGSSSRSSPTT